MTPTTGEIKRFTGILMETVYFPDSMWREREEERRYSGHLYQPTNTLKVHFRSFLYTYSSVLYSHKILNEIMTL